MTTIKDLGLFVKNGFEECENIEFSSDFSVEKINNYSLINFNRYQKFLFKYLSHDRKLSVSLDNNNFINIHIFTKNNPAILSLTFNKNGLVDFLALESEDGQNESKPFYFKGVIETSNNKKYAYKIKRLLSFLDEIDNERNVTSDYQYIIKARSSNSHLKYVVMAESISVSDGECFFDSRILEKMYSYER